MRTILRLATLAALAFSITTGSFSASHAASCDLKFKRYYKCSATFDDGGSTEYCLRAETGFTGGVFALAEQSGGFFFCTCGPRGRAPYVEFGGASGDFICRRDEIVLAGKVSGTKLTGFGSTPDVRSAFTCRAVETCP